MYRVFRFEQHNTSCICTAAVPFVFRSHRPCPVSEYTAVPWFILSLLRLIRRRREYFMFTILMSGFSHTMSRTQTRHGTGTDDRICAVKMSNAIVSVTTTTSVAVVIMWPACIGNASLEQKSRHLLLDVNSWLVPSKRTLGSLGHRKGHSYFVTIIINYHHFYFWGCCSLLWYSTIIITITPSLGLYVVTQCSVHNCVHNVVYLLHNR